ncbi:MAG: LytTR family DNA-binding domain-containing protein [Bacteroidota bacterium]
MNSEAPIHCIIVDDEKLARDLLEALVREEPDLVLQAKCRNTAEAATALAAHPADLIFLDIQMPSQTGLAFLREMRPEAQVILVTAYPDFALEGFELEVADYLLKPVTDTRFRAAVQRVRADLQRRTKAEAFESLGQSGPEFITVRSGYDEFRVFLSEIVYVESDGEYLRLHTPDKSYLTLGALKTLEAELPTDRFQRIHRSYLIASRHVRGRVGHHLQLTNGKLLPIGRTYRKTVYMMFDF